MRQDFPLEKNDFGHMYCELQCIRCSSQSSVVKYYVFNYLVIFLDVYVFVFLSLSANTKIGVQWQLDSLFWFLKLQVQ